jgi:hypothetical protein
MPIKQHLPPCDGRQESHETVREIDAVIAWVDGSDAQHLASRLKHSAGRRRPSSARFADSGEIYYCIASILKYAPFIRRIWIVSDAQSPKFLPEFAEAGLCEPDFIQVVDHTELLSDFTEALPTFNSRTIEAVLWRIPGLSERFVYFNDDFFANRPLRPEEFFVDGRPVLRGERARPERKLMKSRIRRLMRTLGFRGPKVRPTFRLAQELSANHVGVAGNFMMIGHHPHPMRRSVQEAFFAARPELLREQVRHRFRDIAQYSPVALANHLEIVGHGATYRKPVKVAYVKPGPKGSGRRFLGHIRNETTPFGCIQNLEKFEADAFRVVRRLMREKLGKFLPSTIELTEVPEESRRVAEKRAAANAGLQTGYPAAE